MDQHHLLLASLMEPTTRLDDTLASLQQLNRPSIAGSGLAGLLGTRRSTTKSLIVQKLMLDLVKAESAIEEYQSSVAEELALRASLARSKRAYLQATLAPPKLTTTPQPSTSLFAKSCVIPVNKSRSAAAKLDQKSNGMSLLDLASRCSSVPRVAERTQKEKEEKYLSPTKLLDLQKPLDPPTVPQTNRGVRRWDISISFPSKLFVMIEQAESEGHGHIISFLPDGKSFMIHQPEKFAQLVLPKHFRTSRLSSLQKQLSLYGFKRVRSGQDVGAIHHEFFRRDNKKLVAKITRKGQGVPADRSVKQTCQSQLARDQTRGERLIPSIPSWESCQRASPERA